MSPRFKSRGLAQRRVQVLLALATGLVGSFLFRPLLDLAAAQLPSRTAGAAPNSAITGVVVDGTTQSPIAGAIVMLLGASPPPGLQTAGMATSPSGQAAATTTPLASFTGVRQITDDRGRFVFTGLFAMSYLLEASKFGYVDGVYGRTATRDGMRGSARRIDLADGRWIQDLRIELARPCAINGTVTDEAGEAVVGVTVRAFAEIYIGGVRRFASASGGITDDRGAYRIANLMPGRYIVAVPSVQHAVPTNTPELQFTNITKELDPAYRLALVGNSPLPPPSAEGRSQFYPTTFYPGSPSIANASTVVLQTGDDRPAVDLQLKPIRGFRISGRVEGPSDAAGGLSLRLMSAGTETLGRGSESATALTAPDGSFAFLNVGEGSYTVIASRLVAEFIVRSGTAIGPEPPPPPGVAAMSTSSTALTSAPPGTEFRRQTVAGNERFSARQPVSVGGDMLGLVIQLQAGMTIAGHIVVDLDGDVSKEQALIQLRVEPADADPNLGLGQLSLTRRPNDSRLDFRFDGLMAGPYLLRSGFGTIKSITWHGQDYTDTPFDGRAGHDFQDVVVTITDKTTTFSGQVFDRAGQPAPNAAVIAFPAEPSLWANYGLQPTRLRASLGSVGGTYVLRGLPAGDYLLVAVDDGQVDRRTNQAFLQAASRVATRVSIGWGEIKTQSLKLQEIK